MTVSYYVIVHMYACIWNQDMTLMFTDQLVLMFEPGTTGCFYLESRYICVCRSTPGILITSSVMLSPICLVKQVV